LRMEDTFAFYGVWNTDAGAWMLLWLLLNK